MIRITLRLAVLAAGLGVAACAVVPPENPYPQGGDSSAAPPQHLPPSPPSAAPIGTNAPLPTPGT